jgi:hypothetical protein
VCVAFKNLGGFLYKKKVEPAGLCSCLKPLLRRGLQGDHRRHR